MGSQSQGSMVLHVQENVAVHIAKSKDTPPIKGQIAIISPKIHKEGAWLRWTPYFCTAAAPLLIETPYAVEEISRQTDEEAAVAGAANRNDMYAMEIQLNRVHSIVKHMPTVGVGSLMLNMPDTMLPPLYFHSGGLKEALFAISEQVTLSNDSRSDPNRLFVNHNSVLLKRSLKGLDLTSVPSPFMTTLKDVGWGLVGSLQDVARYNSASHKEAEPGPCRDKPQEEGPGDEEWVMDAAFDAFQMVSQPKQEETKPTKGDKGSSMGSWLDEAPVPPMTVAEWRAEQDGEGRIRDMERLRSRVYHAGLDKATRSEAWPLLLEVYPPDSTFEERAGRRVALRQEYYNYKRQWESITERQAQRHAAFRDRAVRVGKDVVRTDRTLHFYEGQDNVRIQEMSNALVTWTMYNFDLAYVQGMSDFFSPLLYVMEDETDAFWCFVGLMDHYGLATNFEIDQRAIQDQLCRLATLVAAFDAELFRFLKERDSDNMFFAFRWILCHYKREFEFEEVLRIFETIWAAPTKEFPLYMAVAIMIEHRDSIIQPQAGFDDIVKVVNDMARTLDLEKTLARARAIAHSLTSEHNSPPKAGTKHQPKTEAL